MYEHVMAEMTQLRAAIEKSGRPFMYPEDWVHAPALAQDCRNPQRHRRQDPVHESRGGPCGSHAAQCGAVVDDRRTFAHSHGMPLAAVLYLKRVEARARGESIGVREVTPMSAMWQLAYQLRGARSSKPILSMSRIEA
jgi:hypothetical protein